MIYQNIMIDRIKKKLASINCTQCPFCDYDKIEQCDKINECSNEQYI